MYMPVFIDKLHSLEWLNIRTIVSRWYGVEIRKPAGLTLPSGYEIGPTSGLAEFFAIIQALQGRNFIGIRDNIGSGLITFHGKNYIAFLDDPDGSYKWVVSEKEKYLASPLVYCLSSADGLSRNLDESWFLYLLPFALNSFSTCLPSYASLRCRFSHIDYVAFSESSMQDGLRITNLPFYWEDRYSIIEGPGIFGEVYKDTKGVQIYVCFQDSSTLVPPSLKLAYSKGGLQSYSLTNMSDNIFE